MFGSLVRRMMGEEARSGRATRFTPRLEDLDGRVLPGGLTGGVVGSVYDSTAVKGGICGDCGHGSHSVISGLRPGEEIPTAVGRGETGLTITAIRGEEIPTPSRSKGEEIPTPSSGLENGTSRESDLLSSKPGAGTDGEWGSTLHGVDVEL